MQKHIEQPRADEVNIPKDTVFESVKNERNGLLKDKFTNYWIKRMNVSHQDITTATNVTVRTDSTFHLGSRWKEAL